ncbi:hypothetical protein SCALM49S_06137 [Streptomyces californicus]
MNASSTSLETLKESWLTRVTVLEPLPLDAPEPAEPSSLPQPASTVTPSAAASAVAAYFVVVFM